VSGKVIYTSIGRQHTYQEVWNLQSHLQQKLIKAKRGEQKDHPGYLLFCEHNPVYTIGKSGKIEHLLLPQKDITNSEFEFFRINRGGDITYHGPGQITAYPILDLDQYYHDLHRYVRDLEEVVIRTIARWGIEGQRVEGYTGVWIKDDLQFRKICAIGVHMSRWVSMHGFALNVNTDLNHFVNIVPCGITEDDHKVTSVQRELGEEIDMQAVRSELREQFEHVFDMEFMDEMDLIQAV